MIALTPFSTSRASADENSATAPFTNAGRRLGDHYGDERQERLPDVPRRRTANARTACWRERPARLDPEHGQRTGFLARTEIFRHARLRRRQERDHRSDSGDGGLLRAE